jgi:hypothetical protein
VSPLGNIVPLFAELFRGRTDAIGLDVGGVQRREVTREDYAAHLAGRRPIGIFPMLDSDHVWFGAIDLDEPNFEAAKLCALDLPGCAFVEKSRSGNAHVWVFFDAPTPAWAVRGLLLKTLEAGLGRRDVEVFPKQDHLRPGMVGNYINLPLFGNERPIIHPQDYASELIGPGACVKIMHETRTSREEWLGRARLFKIEDRRYDERADFGMQPVLHRCAQHILVNREQNPLQPGHRHVVLFNLAKMLLNYAEMPESEAWDYYCEVNAAATRPLPESELETMFRNVKRGQWTSTGCDEALMAPYVDPDCPIARGS